MRDIGKWTKREIIHHTAKFDQLLRQVGDTATLRNYSYFDLPSNGFQTHAWNLQSAEKVKR